MIKCDTTTNANNISQGEPALLCQQRNVQPNIKNVNKSYLDKDFRFDKKGITPIKIKKASAPARDGNISHSQPNSAKRRHAMSNRNYRAFRSTS